MKFLILGVAIMWQLSGLSFRSQSQEPNEQASQLHFTFSFPQSFKGRYELTASNAQTVHPHGTDSILQLRGNVEVRTVVCRPTGNICDKSPVVLRAEAIDFNEATGEMQAKGAVHTVLTGPWPDAKVKD